MYNDVMKSNFNNIIKPYDEELHDTHGRPAELKIQTLCPRFVRNKRLIWLNEKRDQKEIDYWILDRHQCHIGSIEVERAMERRWRSHEFPYDTASVLVKKEKYAKLPGVTFFVCFNYSMSNLYAVVLNADNLKDEYVEKINVGKGSMATEGEIRYALPKELCIWGCNDLQDFIMEKCTAYCEENT